MFNFESTQDLLNENKRIFFYQIQFSHTKTVKKFYSIIAVKSMLPFFILAHIFLKWVKKTLCLGAIVFYQVVYQTAVQLDRRSYGRQLGKRVYVWKHLDADLWTNHISFVTSSCRCEHWDLLVIYGSTRNMVIYTKIFFSLLQF